MYPKEATALCKTILRNGYDAYIVNIALQQEIYELSGTKELDIACEPTYEVLGKLIPNLERSHEEGVIATLYSEQGWLYRFYSSNVAEASDPELALLRITPHMRKTLQEFAPERHRDFICMPHAADVNCFEDHASCGTIKFTGIAQNTLASDYSLAYRALRMAANYDLPVDQASWVAIVQAQNEIVDIVPNSRFMEEWRKVAAENMWKFILLLKDACLLHFLMPEVLALTAIRQNKSKDDLDEEDLFQHTIDCMRYYPEENLHYDWVGTVAILFHDLGKLSTAEYYDGHWTFFQHHRSACKTARRVLRNFNFDAKELDTIYHMLRNQMRFHSMLTDRGIRRFLTLPERDRLIEMARAHIKAANGSYTNFNHNLKYLERGDTPEQMLEPLLNGNEIMEFTGLPPGPGVGIIRTALLEAQVDGKVTDVNSAVSFVREYKNKIQ